MFNVLKLTLLAFYLLAVFGTVLTVPQNIMQSVHFIVVIVLAIHLAEMLVAFKYVRRYPGPLTDSVALSLLFGFLHWLPLKNSTSA